MTETRGTARRPHPGYRAAGDADRPAWARDGAGTGAGAVVLFGVDRLGVRCWDVLVDAGLVVEHAIDVPAALRALSERPASIVIADLAGARALAARNGCEVNAAHLLVVVGAAPGDLHAAFALGADDVVRAGSEPEELAARVAAGLRAGRLRAGESLLRSMVANIPGALYRCACDSDWTMEWISAEIEEISGHPATDFIRSSVRTFASVIHPDDREQVERSVMEGVEARRPYTLEYRIVRADGDVRWVLERGQAQEPGDGRRWLDGAIFDITARRAAEQALREHAILETQLAEVRASRMRIIEAADRARREIERNLHDGAQQRFVSVALGLQLWLNTHADVSSPARAGLESVLGELRTGLEELRDLAHGLHPAVLTDRGLDRALQSLATHASVPVELHSQLPPDRLPIAVEAAAYFTVSEALTNVAKYSSAERAWVEVRAEDDRLLVTVADDGRGGADVGHGSGLQGLRDRLAAVNGMLTVVSPAGEGTTVHATLPIPSHDLDP